MAWPPWPSRSASSDLSGLSPTRRGSPRPWATPARVFDVDLVGTQRLLDAFEALVVTGSAAVCFSSMAAYQLAPFATAEIDALIDEPMAPDFLERAVGLFPDSGMAYGLAKRG